MKVLERRIKRRVEQTRCIFLAGSATKKQSLLSEKGQWDVKGILHVKEDWSVILL